jgi:hypothetical protein
MKWMVTRVQPIAPLTLQVWFADGTLGHVRFEPSHLTGVFEALQNPSVFAQAHIEHGAVTWPGHIDLAPDAMYHHIKAHGQWVLV